MAQALSSNRLETGMNSTNSVRSRNVEIEWQYEMGNEVQEYLLAVASAEGAVVAYIQSVDGVTIRVEKVTQEPSDEHSFRAQGRMFLSNGPAKIERSFLGHIGTYGLVTFWEEEGHPSRPLYVAMTASLQDVSQGS